MDKVEEVDKNRVGIFTQVSADVTAAGEGLVLNKTKSPVTTNKNSKQLGTIGAPSCSRPTAGGVDEIFSAYLMNLTNTEDETVGTGEREMSSDEENRILNDDEFQSLPSSDSSDADVTVAENPAMGMDIDNPLDKTLAKTLSLTGAKVTSTPDKRNSEPTKVCKDGSDPTKVLRNTGPEQRCPKGPTSTHKGKVHPNKQNKVGEPTPDLKKIDNARRTVRRYGSGDQKKLCLRDWKRLSWARKLLAKFDAKNEAPSDTKEKKIGKKNDQHRASTSKAAAASNPRVIPENGPKHSRVQDAGESNRQKRGRQNDTSSPKETDPKKYKSANSAQTPINIQAAVINAGSPEGKLTNEQWSQVEVKLLEFVNEEILASTGFVPTFGPLSTVKGFKVLACCGEPTLNWLRDKVGCMKGLLDGVTLSVALKDDLPTRPKVRINVPGPNIDETTLERYLRAQNPSLPSADWKVMQMEAPTKSGREAIIMLNHETMAMLPSLDFLLRFGINAVKVRPVTAANLQNNNNNN
ncbi:uncharacterized protein LOC129920124 [Episyrphus balteatus]|uniref:uncharacterized protein LOC129920124 n=1 Tax=Episyrphus balteatus TaxID=286459 RepID=UPI0024856996|nr:uncharacterized protein LOC129920124 [Episyrphus balteatus]